jgi:hypothetical protein
MRTKRNRDSLFSNVTDYEVIDSWQGQGFFFPSSRPDRQFSHVASCPLGTFSRLVKQPEGDANHSLPHSADVMNAWKETYPLSTYTPS